MPSIHVHQTGAQVFTYKQLQFATNNFNSSNIINHRGFWSVYNSILGDGRVATIKQLNKDGKQGGREFIMEVTHH